MDDTIIAISTPLGESGIGVVRMSGPETLAIGDRIFLNGKKKTSQFPTHTLHHGYIVDPQSGEKIDEVMLALMRSPRSFTKEDMLEINCHGGMVPLRRVLEVALREGARLAEPGEFTKRAFLNGRIDLSQAEAVVDIIKAKTTLGLKVALHQLGGYLSSRVKTLRGELIEILSRIEMAIDFPEDIEWMSYGENLCNAEEALEEINKLLATAEEGRILREGVNVAIVGRTNIGKSSLLNAFLQEERAIVTPIPGTTRDTIEEIVDIKGVPFRIIDTAGIRAPKDVIEAEGVRRSRRSIKAADLILFILNGAERLTDDDRKMIEEVKYRKTIVVINKGDLPEAIEIEEIKDKLHDKRIIKVSVSKGKGLEELKEAIIHMVLGREVTLNGRTLVTNVRHKNVLTRARESLGRAIEAMRVGVSEEFVAVDLREALESLGQITGQTTTEDILDEIFSHFCIGK
jgi:tRNA modification GTPase